LAEDTEIEEGGQKPPGLWSRFLTVFRSWPILLVAFAFAIMADPISSTAYAIQAALEALNNDLRLILPTMGLVILVIAIIVANYTQLVSRFPQGGGGAAASGEAFGEAWAFVPIGALMVDFVLTISVSVSSGASNIVAYLPDLSSLHVVLALVLLLLVGVISWFGHSARSFFGLMAIIFVVLSIIVFVGGALAEPVGSSAGSEHAGQPPLLAILLAFPIAMALATGVEAPSTAIAQLGQLDNHGRKRFGHLTLYATVVIVGGLTIGFTILAVRLGIRLPVGESTLTAEIARLSVSGFLFAVFQAVMVLLLVAAASSSFQAGPGLLKALAREQTGDDEVTGILPERFGQTNRYYTPYWSVLVYGVLAAAVVLAGRADEQELVLFYAVSVFLSFLAGLLAMVAFSYREGKWLSFAFNIVGTLVVAFVLVMNLARVTPIASLGAALIIAIGLYALWVKRGRPHGIAGAEAQE
jgi:amino acid transporter